MGAARQARWTLGAAVAALVCFIVVFAVAGTFVRSVVADAFAKSESVREARTLLDQTVKLQIDEETGVRGFASTSDRLFLDPYTQAHAQLPADFARLETILRGLSMPETASEVGRAAATNRAWLAVVAAPLLAGKAKNRLPIEKQGKALLDRFRAQMAAAGNALRLDSASLSADMQSAIWHIGFFIFGAIAVTLVFATAFLVAQFRFLDRVDRDRRAAEQERARAADLRAAYRTEKRIADTLQDALIQQPLPSLDGLDLSASYVPAAEESKVGGDWYDVMEAPGNRVLFAIGDVAGHGIEAAVTMNQARQSLVSSAIIARDPASILAHANAELFGRNAAMVTAIAGFADYHTYEIEFAIAGHPPPLLIEPGRAPRFLACGGLPLGVAAQTVYRTQRVQTVPGAAIVLYTDGAIEHSRDALQGEIIFVEAVSSAYRSTAPKAAAIYDAIFRDRSANDDVAILTIGFQAASRRGIHPSARPETAGRVPAETAARRQPPRSVASPPRPAVDALAARRVS